MDRRTFVGTLGAAAASSLLPGDLLAADKVNKVGLQLYTVRSLMQQSVERTLATVAGIGYKEVEFAGYFNRPPRSVRQLLKRNGLSSPSAHVGIDTVRGPWNRTLNDASEVGHKWLLVAWLAEADRNSVDAVKRTADLFNRAGEDAKRYDLKFAYHNHDFEFKEVGGKRILDLLLENTDPKLVDFEMDLYWVVKGGADPLDYFRRYPGRFPMVHVKDAGPAPDRTMTEVGKGTIDFPSIFAQRKLAGLKHYFVEHDNPADPVASVRESFGYLSKMRF